MCTGEVAAVKTQLGLARMVHHAWGPHPSVAVTNRFLFLFPAVAGIVAAAAIAVL